MRSSERQRARLEHQERTPAGRSREHPCRRDAPRPRRRRARPVALDGVDEHRRGRHRGAARPDEVLDEAAIRSRTAPPDSRPPAAPTCSSSERETLRKPFADVEQVVEVERPFLVVAELRRQHREHRPIDDRRLDERAGVEADDRGRVIHRVEVVGAAVLVDRVRAPHTTLPAARQRGQRVGGHSSSRCGCGRTRIAIVAQTRRRLELPDRAPPIAHERCLRRAAPEQRRADIEDERTVGRGKPDAAAEVVAVARRRPIEPLIEALRAGDDHAIGARCRGTAAASSRCDLVPDDHRVRHDANQRLARQVVPAPHAERAADAERARRAHVIELRRAELDERRDRAARRRCRSATNSSTPACRGTACSSRSQRPRQQAAERQARQRQHEDGRALVGALADLRRRLVARIRVAQVVEPEAQRAGQPAVAAPLQDRREARR